MTEEEKEDVQEDKARWYSLGARAHTKRLKARILASGVARAGAYDPNVDELDKELEVERRNVQNWHNYGGQLQESKEEALRRALTYAHDGIRIGRKIGNMKLVHDAVEVLAAIDPRYVIGEEGSEEFQRYSRLVNHSVMATYNKGRGIKPSDSMRYMKEIETLVDKLKKGHKRRRELEEFEAGAGRRSVHVALVFGLIAGISLLLEGVTGYTIGGMSQTASNTIGLVLFILSLVGMFLLSKKNSEK